MKDKLVSLRSGAEGVADQYSAANALDRLTQQASLVLSRRVLLTGTLGGIAAWTGLGALRPLPVGAQSCNTCYGPCTYCNTCTGYCYSPNGAYWAQGCCTCPCNCSCYRSSVTVCDDGGYSTGCPCDCAFCWPNCGCC